jgi:hypothetical protein
MIFESRITGLFSIKISDDAQSDEISIKCRTAMIQARVIVSLYFATSIP